jgi:UDPglucose--hexose-1-phosphate uridylyltransferase
LPLLFMSELRQDPVSQRWVIIARDRENRPNEFQPMPVERVAGSCPFCAGNEAATPEAVAVYTTGAAERHVGKPDTWQVRVVPNKYPAVRADLNGSVRHEPFGQRSSAAGVHEVIIESPRHIASLTDLNADELRLTWIAYRDRLTEHARTSRWKYGQIFKNVGAAAGSSIEHGHSQLVVLPHVPSDLAAELASTEQHLARTGQHLFSELIEQELAAGERIVEANDRFVAFCPFASRFPYEVWVLPRRRLSRFQIASANLPSASDDEMGEMGSFVQQILMRIEGVLNRPAYNFFLHTAPFDSLPYDHYHWHVEIFPRLTRAAGFEWSTGYFINPVPPEEAAAALRG